MKKIKQAINGTIHSIWPSRTSVRWIIFILVLTNIALSYFVFFENKDFKESEIIKFITYTSSLLSILLSIFAIFYAYLTSIDTSNRLTSINGVLEAVQTENKNLLDHIHSLNNHYDKLSQAVANNNPFNVAKMAFTPTPNLVNTGKTASEKHEGQELNVNTIR